MVIVMIKLSKRLVGKITILSTFMILSTVVSLSFSSISLGEEKQSPSITIWYYKQNLEPLFDQTFKRLSTELGVTINYSFLATHDLKTSLIKSSLQGQGPDLVLAPSDFIAERDIVKFSEVDPKLFPKMKNNLALSTVKVSNKIFGVPMVVGNHLVMYYNKNLVSKPMSSWEEFIQYSQQSQNPDKGIIGWNFGEMYWFIAFSTLFDDEVFLPNQKINLNTKGVQDTLTLLKLLVDNQVIKTECGFPCGYADFLEGRKPYSINGDWAHRDFSKHFKEDLGVVSLPTWRGKSMDSYMSSVTWLFPNQSLDGDKKKILAKIVNETMKVEFQTAVYEQLALMPTQLYGNKDFLDKQSQSFKDLIERLKSARPIPADVTTSASWAGLKKGFDYFWSTRSTTERAAKVMQRVGERELQIKKAGMTEQ